MYYYAAGFVCNIHKHIPVPQQQHGNSHNILQQAAATYKDPSTHNLQLSKSSKVLPGSILIADKTTNMSKGLPTDTITNSLIRWHRNTSWKQRRPQDTLSVMCKIKDSPQKTTSWNKSLCLLSDIQQNSQQFSHIGAQTVPSSHHCHFEPSGYFFSEVKTYSWITMERYQQMKEKVAVAVVSSG